MNLTRGLVSLCLLGCCSVGPALAASGPLLRVTYRLNVRLNESARTVEGSEVIACVNNTGDSLRELWLNLFPNAFRDLHTRYARDKEALGRFDFSLAPRREHGWLELNRFDCARAVRDTGRGDGLAVRFQPPLGPGDTAVIRLGFTTRLPAPFADFGARGRRYVLGHWYPQVAALDRSGWHRAGFSALGCPPGSFADYDVSITVPADLRVGATGRLVSPPGEPDRMKWPPSAGAGPPKTLQFVAAGVPDFAMVIAPDLVLAQDSAWGVRLSVLSRCPPDPGWQAVRGQLLRMVWNYTTWYGPAPAADLTVADVSGLLPADAAFPGLVLVATRPSPFIRALERSVARCVARQWFGTAVAPDELRDPWLAHGLAAFSALRHLEAEYGPDNLLSLSFPVPMLAGLGEDYVNRVTTYIAATNGLCRPPSLPADSFRQNASALSAFSTSQAALQLRALQNRLGEPGLDLLLRDWLGRYRGMHPTFADFCRTLPDSVVPFLLADPGRADYAVTGLRRQGSALDIGLARSAGAPLPVDFEVREPDQVSTRHVWPDTATVTRANVPPVSGLKRGTSSVTLDPDCRLAEPDRWNNHWPRRVEVRPVIGLPSLDAYQVFYGPWLWFDNYRGISLGGWVQGRRFYDAGPLVGDHVWMVSEDYATRLDDWHTALSYQTPLSFLSRRLRVKLMGDLSFIDHGARGILWYEMGRPFRQPKATAGLLYRYWNLYNPRNRDPRAWAPARTAELRAFLSHSYETRLLKGRGQVYAGRQSRAFGGTYENWRFVLEQQHTLHFTRDFSVTLRGFAGVIRGASADRDQFYLSGGLMYNDDEIVSWGYKGMSSGQERWHYDGDVNCRGYAGAYRHGRYAYGLNLSVAVRPWLLPFFDLGNVAQTPDESGFLQPRLDAGVRIRLGPFYADFPVWKSRPEPGETHFAFRWMLGFKLSELTGNI